MNLFTKLKPTPPYQERYVPTFDEITETISDDGYLKNVTTRIERKKDINANYSANDFALCSIIASGNDGLLKSTPMVTRGDLFNADSISQQIEYSNLLNSHNNE